VEVSGHAYRTDFDLSRHQQFSGQDLGVFRKFDTPQKATVLVARPRVDMISAECKKETGRVLAVIKKADPAGLRQLLCAGPAVLDNIAIKPTYVEFMEKEEVVTGVRYIPHVAEPSFGADRLTYLTLECAYSEKEDRTILRLPKSVAPIKACVFPLVNKDGIREKALGVYDEMRKNGIITDFDDGGSIGRRYARSDEIGSPVAITIDYQTLEDNTVTIRDRDTWEQSRVPIPDLQARLRDSYKIR
jgi:glycyl-tRNA synthetase